ncbi:hypothetical protein ACSFA0_26410 [Variovorax sp. LT1P1]|uniref:hypothetical protein n=1 Tax=Variovorax sp. LT1P1 TaxID=3443730 RepID=UPI003F45C82C
MSTKVWNLLYVPGNPKIFTNVTSNAGNPISRKEALEGAELIAANGWRVWVEHHKTGARIYESDAEVAARAQAAKLVASNPATELSRRSSRPT